MVVSGSHTHTLITHTLICIQFGSRLTLSVSPEVCALHLLSRCDVKPSHSISVKCLLLPSYFLFIWRLPQHPVFNYFSPAADASHSNLLWITPLRTNVLWQTPLFQSITRPKSAISLAAKHTPTSNGTSFSLRGCNCRLWKAVALSVPTAQILYGNLRVGPRTQEVMGAPTPLMREHPLPCFGSDELLWCCRRVCLISAVSSVFFLIVLSPDKFTFMTVGGHYSGRCVSQLLPPCVYWFSFQSHALFCFVLFFLALWYVCRLHKSN